MDGKRAVTVWIHPDGKRRVFLIARPDGLFGRWSEYFSEDQFEMCWVADDMGGSFYDSYSTAVREIHGSYPWTTSIQPTCLGGTR